AYKRIWVIGAIHNDVLSLRKMHSALYDKVESGDRIVYTGNMIGLFPHTRDTISEILGFRRWFLSLWPYMSPNDIVYLRGRQEEMLSKMLQLHFAQEPLQIIDYLYKTGLSPVLEGYGFRRHEFEDAAAVGASNLAEITTRLARVIRNYPGHDDLFKSLKHAAYSEDGVVLCVSSGLNGKIGLRDQGDNFWWGGENFARITHAYGGYCRLVRGFDPQHGGYREGAFTVSLDQGESLKTVQAVCLDRFGEIVDRLSFSS
ncbi:MAG: hypothetical protein R3261_06885, partial [Alphaproteobacteria bacterium]|nr:hypothetical protein [Alphaproteobacteria bacterium]